MPRTIDLNADLGEGYPWDLALLGRVTSAGVCCGAHAGDRSTSLRTLRWAEGLGVVVGAHPGYPDRENFGRDERWIDDPAHLAALGDEVHRQVAELRRLAEEAGATLRFVKAHGALYNRAQVSGEVAVPLVTAVADRGLPILGQPGGLVEKLARTMGVPFIAEGFADRRYLPDGRLVPRTEPDAILRDPAEIRAQVLALVDRGIRTLCIHGDDPGSVELADLVLATLNDAGIEPRGFA